MPDSGLSRHNGRSNTSAAAELAEFRKITIYLKKNIIFNEILPKTLRSEIRGQI